MNKQLLVGLFVALMALVPLSGYADQTIDAPHINVDSNGGTEDCTYCHFANYQPSDCVRCHSNNNAPYGDSTAPLVNTHRNLNCQACHNPHVSLQAEGITGAYTGALANTPSAGMTTLTGVAPTPQVSWAEKTGPGRGMILWVSNGTDAQGNPQSASFEVDAVDAAAATVTVKGAVPVASGSFDLRRGQLIAKKVTKTASSSYRQGDIPVQFPSQGSASIFIDTVNGTPTGVCQVCHTQTQYWKSDGTSIAHNADKPCTDCHKHSSGFMVTGCAACHPGPEPDGPPTVFPGEMASPSTGSMTAGQHAIHATPAGYNFPCGTCHYDTGMDRINAPDDIVKGDGIQIGFSWGKFMGYLTSYNGQASVTVPYDGTNNTTVTNTGAVGSANLTCSNVYCHSDGTAIRRNCATSTLNTSQSWDGFSADPQGDTQKCNNCHGFRNGMANTMTSGKHLTHVKNLSMPCYYCHADTVSNNGSGVSILSNKTNHVNAVYDVKGGGFWYDSPIVMDKNITSGTGSWNPTTKNCTVICHAYSRTWTNTDTGACPDLCATDPTACQNIDPVQPVATCYNVGANTFELIDRSYDPDYNDSVKAVTRGGGHTASTPGQFRINWWNKGNFFEYPLLTDKPVDRKASQFSFSSAFLAANNNTAIVRYTTFDNDPQSLNNYNAVPRQNGGWVFGAWTTCTYGAYSPTVNELPIMDYVASVVNSNTIRVIDRSTDIDWNTTPSNPAWTGVDKNAANTCGNDGSTAQLRFQFLESTGVAAQNVNVILTDVPKDTTVTYTYSAARLQMSKTVWWTYAIRDNTFIKCGNTGYLQRSGWQSLTMP